ncbi:MAG: SH3 domain-containing protein [Chlamydiota bacterium]
MSKAVALIAPVIAVALPLFALADNVAPIASVEQTSNRKDSRFKAFTGKIIGNNVRMRIDADLDSHIISELSADDYVVVKDERGEFYAVEPPGDLKAYIFRGFVIDDVVEGQCVNIRLAPDRDAPIIGHYSTGHSIDGKICDGNNKWLEIEVPQESRFYIAKEYVEYAGEPQLKKIQDKRKATVTELLESTKLLSQGEMHKAFPEIDIERITHGYRSIITDYGDLPKFVNQATTELSAIQKDYLHRKIAFLEAKASEAGRSISSADIYESAYRASEATSSPTDRMKIWEPIEEALYLGWSSMHHAKTMDDFYTDQKMKCQTVSGILEAYKEPVKNKPGDFILKEHDITIAYVYSTQVDLDRFVGKRVSLLVSPRPNHNFAFPAYYVIEVE